VLDGAQCEGTSHISLNVCLQADDSAHTSNSMLQDKKDVSRVHGASTQLGLPSANLIADVLQSVTRSSESASMEAVDSNATQSEAAQKGGMTNTFVTSLEGGNQTLPWNSERTRNRTAAHPGLVETFRSVLNATSATLLAVGGHVMAKQLSFSALQLHQDNAMPQVVSIAAIFLLFFFVVLPVACLYYMQRTSDPHEAQPRSTPMVSSPCLSEKMSLPASPSPSMVQPSKTLVSHQTNESRPSVLVKTTLCPELVVPACNECTLLVPWLASAVATSSGSPLLSNGRLHEMTLSIKDQREEPLFCVAVKFIARGEALVNDAVVHNLCARGDSRLSLTSTMGGSVYASVSVGVVVQDKVETLALYNASNKLYGQLSVKGNNQMPDFKVVDQSGNEITFCRRMASGRCDVVDNKGWPVAMVMPGPASDGMVRRLVRIGPQMDVGLVLLSLLGIDLLELARS